MTEAVDGGAIAKNIELDRSSPRGVWRAEMLVDGQEAAAGNVSWSVEDFVPQRLRVQIEASEAVLRARPNAADQRAGRLPLWRAGRRPRGGSAKAG